MAALEEGFQYGLSSNSISGSNKTVVQVKLTDTSLRLIEEYLRKKPSCSQKPCIQFQGNHGSIQIPEGGENLRTFQFSLSGLQGDPNGSFDAICQPRTRNGKQLALEGSMTNKIQIHATNELFKATKERVTKAELDNKKVSTKEIKPSGPHISRKKTTVLRNPHPSIIPRHQPVQPAKPKPSTAPPVNFTKRPSPSYGSQGHAVSPHNPATSSKPTSPSLSSHNPSAKQPAGNPAVMSMPYRDRIIHLLAIRPYKKPELIIRLRKDGVRDKDKDQLGVILNQVAVAKDNSFTLAKHIYADVRMDWQFYTEEDRQILKKKLQSASTVSPSASPNSRSPDSQSANLTQKKSEPLKRSMEDSHQTAQHTAKKKRISLYDKNGHKSESRASSTDRHSNSSSNSNNVSSTTDISDKKENIDDTVDSTSDTPEYMRQYHTIADDDQRYKYKQAFNEEYEEYRDLHSSIDLVSKKFCEMQELRRKTQKGTSEFQNLEDKIRNEYMLQKSDPKFIEQMRRYKYLHKKLAYIKNLIMDYDQKIVSVTS